MFYVYIDSPIKKLNSGHLLAKGNTLVVSDITFY